MNDSAQSHAETAYRKLERRARRVMVLGQVEGVLHWDMATMMPRGGAEARAEQLAALKAQRHALLTHSAMAELLDAAEAEDGLDPWQHANVHELRRRWTHAVAVDEALVEALSKAGSHCEMAWREARPRGDFAAVLPHLEALVPLVRESARAQGEMLGVAPYDALLDTYEPDGRTAEIDPVFDDLAAFLPPFLDRVLERQAARPSPTLPAGPFPRGRQRKLGLRVMAALGFDFDHGRLDASHHPFCGGVPDDIRITTRYDENNFISSLMAITHETGHALYECGLPAAWRLQPVGLARGMSIHEGQALLIEMQVVRSRPFLAFAAPLMRDVFGGKGSAWEVENLYRLMTRVGRSLIRVDADEVTYPLHVVLRYRLERAMLSGDLAPADLPRAWNEGMERLIGVVPPTDREGCLQDLHWYDGAWGYFPTYTLGAIVAAQIFAAARRSVPEIDPGIVRGDFAPLLGYLRRAVHGRGSLVSTGVLLREATGAPLSTVDFKAHLEARYLA